MKTSRRHAIASLILAAALAAPAVHAFAALSGHLDVLSGSAGMGQLITVVLQVSNGDSVSVTAVSPSLSVGAGSAALVSGPSPALADLAPSGFANFSYSYSVTGCGNLYFTATASGTESASPVTLSSVSSLTLTVSCPTLTPTPSVSPTAGPSPTPAPTLVSPTAVPGASDARVLGSKFHPDQGESVGFKATLPFGGPLTISIYSRQGKKLKTIQFEGVPGDNLSSWDGRDDVGDTVATGIYAVFFQGNGLNKVCKVVVIK